MNDLTPKKRCVVYTRKSTEEGLEQEFNSLDAQREAGESYIASQRHEGWVLLPDQYDDGGFSGGNTDRPALKRLLEDIKTGQIDIVVVYKVDRLSRSLSDFAKLMEVFEEHNVSFVSVTQQFNTSTSMGRLMLNVLLSFAQFEREVIGERVRDKMAASKRKGMWMGGCPPLGYDIVDKKLIVNPDEAKIIEHIYLRFLTLGSAKFLTRELREQGYRSKSYTTKKGRNRVGKLLNLGVVYQILKNPVYIGEIHYMGNIYPGQHQAIISRDLWDRVRAVMQEDPYQRARHNAAKTPALLRGVITCSGCQSAMTPTFVTKDGKTYRYYKPSAVAKATCTDCPLGPIPAGEIESIIFDQMKAIFRTPEMIIKTWRAAKVEDKTVSEKEVADALSSLESLWDQLFPAEQQRIVKLLIDNVSVSTEGIDLRLRSDGLTTLVQELQASPNKEAAA